MSARALELSGVFSDGMVLQQGRPLPVWGWCAPGARIAVTFGTARSETVTDATGAWRVDLPPASASATPADLLIEAGAETRRIGDVLVGEVYLASGQSNMEWPVRESLDGDLLRAGATDPAIRMLRVDRVVSASPRPRTPATWCPATGAAVDELSAVAYCFARELRAVLGVPVGIIDAAWGGTPVIAWTRAEVCERQPLLRERVARWRDQPNPERPQDAPAVLANGMLAPVAPYALAGLLWYQGETDAWSQPDRYHDRLGPAIADWRTWWEQPELPVGIVQLANFKEPQPHPVDAPWAHLRDSQARLARELPRVGLAVSHDLGEGNDIHPRDKRSVALRLARWALCDIYHRLELAGGPVVREHQRAGAAIRIRFDRVAETLLAYQGEPLIGFTLAGADRRFHHAEARIVSPDTIEVSASAVPEPVSVRYAWQNNPRGANLSNSARLPAGPFRLDDWPFTPPAPETPP